jgi:hypothetical protein
MELALLVLERLFCSSHAVFKAARMGMHHTLILCSAALEAERSKLVLTILSGFLQHPSGVCLLLECGALEPCVNDLLKLYRGTGAGVDGSPVDGVLGEVRDVPMDLAFAHEQGESPRDAPTFQVVVAALASHPGGLAALMASGWLALLLAELEELGEDREMLLPVLLSEHHHPRLHPLYLVQEILASPAVSTVLCALSERDPPDQVRLRAELERPLRTLMLEPALGHCDDKHHLGLLLLSSLSVHPDTLLALDRCLGLRTVLQRAQDLAHDDEGCLIEDAASLLRHDLLAVWGAPSAPSASHLVDSDSDPFPTSVGLPIPLVLTPVSPEATLELAAALREEQTSFEVLLGHDPGPDALSGMLLRVLRLYRSDVSRTLEPLAPTGGTQHWRLCAEVLLAPIGRLSGSAGLATLLSRAAALVRDGGGEEDDSSFQICWLAVALHGMFPDDVEEAYQALVLYSRLPGLRAVAWPLRGGDGDATLGIITTIVEQELPDLACALLRWGCTVMQACRPWLDQGWWGTLGPAKIAWGVLLPPLYGLDYHLYFVVAVCKHLSHALELATNQEGPDSTGLHPWLCGLVADFAPAESMRFLHALCRRYRPWCVPALANQISENC